MNENDPWFMAGAVLLVTFGLLLIGVVAVSIYKTMKDDE